MQSALIEELLSIMNMKLFGIVVQLIVVGAILMWLKDFSTKILDFIKIKFSDFGRGTKIEISGRTGYIMKVGFNEVEIDIDVNTTMIVPVSNFVKANKIIMKHEIKVDND